MSPIDHAGAHDRIGELLLEPARLVRLETSTDPADVELRAHIAGCETCRADLRAWRDVQQRLAEAIPASEPGAFQSVEPIRPPEPLRERVIEAAVTAGRGGAAWARHGSIAREPIGSSSGPSRWQRLRAAIQRPRWAGALAVAAAIVIVAGGVLTIDQANHRAAAEAEAASLGRVTAAVDRVLAEPQHKVVQLARADGSPGGSISWTRHDLVVLSDTLAQPDSGHAYRCWLVEGDRVDLVGAMDFAGDLAYWVGTLDSWATFQVGPQTQFVVTLEPADATAKTGPAVLSAEIGG